MDIGNVSKNDLINCQRLFNALKAGKFEIAGPDVTALGEAINWMAHLGVKMGENFQKAQKEEDARKAVSSVGAAPSPKVPSVPKPFKSSKKRK